MYLNFAEDLRTGSGDLCGRTRVFGLDFAEDRDLLDFTFANGFWTALILKSGRMTLLAHFLVVKFAEDDMKTLELKAQDFPLSIRLQTVGGSKQYVLVKTKQDKLLLNKPVENTSDKS